MSNTFATATKACRALIQSPAPEGHKGSSGRMLIVGGSVDYTGAPYFVSMAALRAGIDMTTVLCPPEAAPAIKGYSPDLIVRPVVPNFEDNVVYDAPKAIETLKSVMSRSHSLVVGPGFGVPTIHDDYSDALLKGTVPTVVDASGLSLLLPAFTRLAHDAARTPILVLTPNINEIKILYAAVQQAGLLPHTSSTQEDAKASAPKNPHELADAVAIGLRCTVLLKGRVDYVVTSTGDGKVLHSQEVNFEQEQSALKSSDRRAAGQGDLLSGLVGTFLAWSHKGDPTPTAGQNAACAGSLILKQAAAQRFARDPRFVTSDLLSEVGAAVSAYASASSL